AMARLRISCPACRVALTFEAALGQQHATCPACGQRMGLPLGRLVSRGWFVARGKQKVGPYDLPQLRELVAAGCLQPQDMRWPEGSRRWPPAGSVGGLFPRAAAAPPAPLPERRFLWSGVAVVCLVVSGAVFLIRQRWADEPEPLPSKSTLVQGQGPT